MRWLLLLSVVCAACASDKKKTCPPKGIGVEEFEGVAAHDQIVRYKEYACSEAQICPDLNAYPVTAQVAKPTDAPFELSFLLTNCSTAAARLEITKIEVWGDDRCHFTNAELAGGKTTIDPTEQVVMRTTYKPLAAGDDFAELRVKTNAKNYPELRIFVCGRAQVGPISADLGVPPAADAGAKDGAVKRDLGKRPDQGVQPRFECKEAKTQAACHK